VAEAEEAIVVVPVILEIPEVELEIAIGVRVHVGHPVVAIEDTSSFVHHAVRYHRDRHQPISELHAEPYVQKLIRSIA
jgi:hypothetical protein